MKKVNVREVKAAIESESRCGYPSFTRESFNQWNATLHSNYKISNFSLCFSFLVIFSFYTQISCFSLQANVNMKPKTTSQFPKTTINFKNWRTSIVLCRRNFKFWPSFFQTSNSTKNSSKTTNLQNTKTSIYSISHLILLEL